VDVQGVPAHPLTVSYAPADPDEEVTMDERKTLSEHEILTTADADERARRGVVDADGGDDSDDSDDDGTDAGDDSDSDGTDAG
jgi:hypothetical protein